MYYLATKLGLSPTIKYVTYPWFVCMYVCYKVEVIASL